MKVVGSQIKNEGFFTLEQAILRGGRGGVRLELVCRNMFLKILQ